MAESTGRSSVAVSVFEALETLVGRLPNAFVCDFDHLPDDQSQLPVVAVQTLQEKPSGRPYVDGGSVSRCQIALALRRTGDDAASRIEACELWNSIASALSNATGGGTGTGVDWRIEDHSQPYFSESAAGRSDYRVTLTVTYRTHL